MSTRYSVEIHNTEGWESIALFADTVSFEGMGAFIAAEFQYGNSLDNPCNAIHVIDMETGEIILSAEVGDDSDDEPDWIDDDMGFDPYLGCYTDDC